MPANKNVEYGWSIWNERLGFFYGSFSDTRKCAIEDHLNNTGMKDWKTCNKYGDRAVKAKIERCEWKKR